MPALRYPRREAFAQNMARSAKTGKSWRQCYADSGYTGQGHVADVGASRLMTCDDVRSRIDEIMMPVVKKARVSIETLLDQLDTTITEARAEKQHSVVVSALVVSAKLVGLLRTQIEVGSPGDFDGCQTTEEIYDKALDELGGLGGLDAALAEIDKVRERVMEAAARRARPIPTAKPKPRLPAQR